MELLLNLAGSAVAIALICLWLRGAESAEATGAKWKTQLVALVLVILVIFPVISVTDDLLAAANPAETDVLSRRHHEFSGLVAAIPATIRPGENVFTQLDVTPRRLIAPLEFQILIPHAPALAPIENRPPPAL